MNQKEITTKTQSFGPTISRTINPSQSVPTKSRGFGDTVTKIAQKTGLDQVAKVYEKATGKDCGCKKRQDALNQAFPYQR